MAAVLEFTTHGPTFTIGITGAGTVVARGATGSFRQRTADAALRRIAGIVDLMTGGVHSRAKHYSRKPTTLAIDTGLAQEAFVADIAGKSFVDVSDRALFGV